jgi:hypothetical protein
VLHVKTQQAGAPDQADDDVQQQGNDLVEHVQGGGQLVG